VDHSKQYVCRGIGGAGVSWRLRCLWMLIAWLCSARAFITVSPMRIARDQAVGIVVGALVLMLVVAGPAAAAFPLLEPPYQLDGPIGPTLAVLDYDADGFLDIAGLGHDGTLTLRRGTSTGFTVAQTLGMPGGSYARALVAADLDGDGRDDLLAAYAQSATVVLIRGRADGALASPAANDIHSFGTATTSNLTAVSIDTADLDGDADLDVAAAMGVDEDGHTPANTLENGHVTIFVNDGQGGLMASPTTLPVNAPADLLLLRLAGDADPDLIVTQRNRDAASTVKIFAGAADASFKAAAYAPAGAQATELDAGNFDDDGRVDVVVAHGNVGPNAPQPGSILPGAGGSARATNHGRGSRRRPHRRRRSGPRRPRRPLRRRRTPRFPVPGCA
jgi:hypothetical protein